GGALDAPGRAVDQAEGRRVQLRLVARDRRAADGQRPAVDLDNAIPALVVADDAVDEHKRTAEHRDRRPAVDRGVALDDHAFEPESLVDRLDRDPAAALAARVAVP